jgi:hypothetical protein
VIEAAEVDGAGGWVRFRTIEVPYLKPLLLLAHFGVFSSADYDAALGELLGEGRVQCRWSAGNAPAADDATRRVPGAQDFLEFLLPQTRPVWRRGL